MNVLGAGRAILYRAPGVDGFHLYFVLTDPIHDGREVVAVMLRTATEFTDDTVVLQPGDHPFVRHATAVHYSTAGLFQVDKLLDAMQRGECRLRQDMNETLLDEVRDGLLRSPFTIHRIRDLCEELFGA